MLRPDGTYVRVAADDATPHRSQAELLALAASRGSSAAAADALPSFDAIAEGVSGNGAAIRASDKRKKKRSTVK